MRLLKRLPKVPMEDEERHAIWLEVFFDLVFVLAVSQLADYLREHLTLPGVLAFAGLFVVVWWTWLSFTFFADLFDPDHVSYRLIMLVVMLLSIMLAVNIGDALGEHAAVFIVLSTLLQAILTGLYLWGRRDANVRILATRFAIGFAIATLFWLLSLWIAAPFRYILWTLALLIEIGTPMLVAFMLKKRPFYVSHIPERLGLFTIIVLGESIIRIGTGLVGTPWQVTSVITAVASFLIAACLWWLYFDRVDAEVMKRSFTEQYEHKRELLRSFAWSYIHVLVFSGLAATSVGISLVIEQVGKPLPLETGLTLGLGCAITLLAITLIQQIGPQSLSLRELISRACVIVLAVILAFVGTWLGPMLVTVVLAFLFALITTVEAVMLYRQKEDIVQLEQQEQGTPETLLAP